MIEWPVPLVLSEFTFEEDLFLMSIYFTENDQTLEAQVINRYQQAHQKNSKIFPKTLNFNKNSNILQDRLTKLLLDNQYKNYREALIRSLNFQDTVDEVQFDDYAVSYMQERAALAEDARKYGKDKLKITLGGPKAPTYTLRRVQICQCSDLLTRESLAANDQLQPEDQTLLVHINDEECLCPVPHTPNHISKDLFEKFILFTRHPFVVQELQNIDEILNIQKSETELLLQSILDMLVGKRKSRISVLEEWRNEMEQRVFKEILSDFEQSIQTLKIKFERLLKQVLDKLNDNYSELLLDTMEFYEKEMKKCEQNVSNFHQVQLQNDNILTKQQNLQVINNAIFKPFELLPNLLTCGLALESSIFTKACITNIAQNILEQGIYNSFILSECQLIDPSICRQILQEIGTKQLSIYYQQSISNGSISLKDFQSDHFREEIIKYEKQTKIEPKVSMNQEKENEDMTITMLQYKHNQSNQSFDNLNVPLRNCFLPIEFIEEEIQQRKIVLKTEYSKLPEQRIKELINKGQEPFPEILQSILDQRINMILNKQYNNIYENQLILKYKDNYILDETQTLATINIRNQFVRVQPNKYLTNKSKSKIYTEIHSQNLTDGTLSVGVFYLNNNKGVFITSDGYLQTNQSKTYLGFEIPENCIISVLVDCQLQTVEFKVNGQKLQCSDGALLQGVSFEQVQDSQKNSKKTDSNGLIDAESLQQFLELYQISQKSKLRDSTQEIQKKVNALDSRSEIEFYVGAEVYYYGKTQFDIKFQFCEPYLLKCPAGYGDTGWM